MHRNNSITANNEIHDIAYKFIWSVTWPYFCLDGLMIALRRTRTVLDCIKPNFVSCPWSEGADEKHHKLMQPSVFKNRLMSLTGCSFFSTGTELGRMGWCYSSSSEQLNMRWLQRQFDMVHLYVKLGMTYVLLKEEPTFIQPSPDGVIKVKRKEERAEENACWERIHWTGDNMGNTSLLVDMMNLKKKWWQIL